MEQTLRVALLDADADVRAGRRLVISSKSNLEIVLDSDGADSDIASVVDGLIDVLIIDQRLASGPAVDFYQTLRQQMGINHVPGCVITAAFEQPALLLAALEVGIDHVSSIEVGPERLLDAIDQVKAGKSEISLTQIHALITSQSVKRRLELDLIKLVEELPEKLASNLRRLRTVWQKANPNQLRDFSIRNLDGLVARLPVQTPAELVIKLERTGLLSAE